MERIPVIVGANHDEQKRNPVQTTGFPATAQTYDKYLKDAFGPLAPLVAAEYPPSAFSDPAYAAGAAASDSGIPNGIGVCPMLTELGGALAKATQTFAYELNDPRGSGMPDANGFELGSMHTAEIGFLYAEIKPGARTPDEMQLAARMQHYWATFARNGRPKMAPTNGPPCSQVRGTFSASSPAVTSRFQQRWFQPNTIAIFGPASGIEAAPPRRLRSRPASAGALPWI